MPVHTMSLTDLTLERSTGASRWPKFIAEEAAELREKGFWFSIYRPEEDEFRGACRCRRSRPGSTGRLRLSRGECGWLSL